jgi:hypothetical protein
MNHSGKSVENKSLCECDADAIIILKREPYYEKTKHVFVPQEIPTVRQT